MLLKVKDLKKALEQAPDEAIISYMGFGKNNQLDFFAPKRFFVGHNKESLLFIINCMGTHWDEKWAKESGDVTITKTIEMINIKK